MSRSSTWRNQLGVLALAAVAALAACEQPIAPGDNPMDATGPALSQQAPGQFMEGRVLARFTPGTNASTAAAAVGANVQREIALGIQVLKVPVGREMAVVRALSRNPNVEFAEPDYIRTFGDPAVMPVNDAFIGYKWDLDNDGFIYSSTGDVLASTGSAGADMSWRAAVEAIGSASGSARIGIMDSGIRHDHEEIQGRIAAEYDAFDGDGDASDDNGHGTHVAGIAAANTDNGVGTAGVAFTGNVEFVITKVCGSTGGGPFNSYGCPSSAIADGIVFAVDNGAHVLNLSLGGGSGSTTTRQALQYARANNVLPFCATGNEAAPVSYPAAWPECVAVSATDWSDNLASYSNSGPEVELAAPGGDDESPDGYSYILSSYYDGPDSYVLMAGTSMASPQAAGLAALLHVLGVTDDDDKLNRMKSTADDLGPAGNDSDFGAGRINVFAAVDGLGDGGGGEDPNADPTAAFTSSCADLACDFDGSGSSDSDGSIASWAWDFGDGSTGSGASASHTYAAGGTYTVTLTVTDDDGATDTSTQDVTVTEPDTGGDITLSGSGTKNRGIKIADLTWSGASSANVDIFRDGGLLTTTANDGQYTDNTGQRGGGGYTYQVCEAGTSTCSDAVTVSF